MKQLRNVHMASNYSVSVGTWKVFQFLEQLGVHSSLINEMSDKCLGNK